MVPPVKSIARDGNKKAPPQMIKLALEIATGLVGLIMTLLGMDPFKLPEKFAKRVLLVLGLFTIGLTGGKAYLDKLQGDSDQREQAARREEELFRFDPQRVQLLFTAHYDGSLVDDQKLLENSPKQFGVEYASFGEAVFRFEFERKREGLFRPFGYRVPMRATLIYTATDIRRDKAGPNRATADRYLWDLNGSKVVFTVPVARFQPPEEGRKWRFEGELYLDPRLPPFIAEPNFRGGLVFELKGIDKQGLLRKASD